MESGRPKQSPWLVKRPIGYVHFECIFFLTFSDVYVNMSDMETIPSDLKKLLRKRDELAGKLGRLKYILRGSIIKQGNICGKPICICKRKDNPILHGPYNYLSHRSRGGINTIFLNKKKLPLAEKGVKEYDDAIGLIYRIAEINFRILRYHYDKL